MNDAPVGSVKFKLEDAVRQGRFRRALLGWYDANKRDLPWRVNRDPYRVWVAEIMLQQTRVAAVIDYYNRFLKRFPTVQKLAAARLDSVLAAWSGLGYYRRARCLHTAAKQIVNEFGSQFPESSEGWRQLPGIGRYTAAAIASIALNEPVAVVDGNVERVLSRITGKSVSGEQRWSLAGDLLSPARPGDFNQAMMELGAMVCLPGEPRCLVCPLRDLCSTRGELARPPMPKRRKRDIYYRLTVRDGAVLLVQRPGRSSLMAGMWELPEIPPFDDNDAAILKLRHSITITDYVVSVCQNGYSKVNGGRWFQQSQLTKLPLTGLTRKILCAVDII